MSVICNVLMAVGITWGCGVSGPAAETAVPQSVPQSQAGMIKNAINPKIQEIMDADNLNITKAYFESQYGPARTIDNSYHEDRKGQNIKVASYRIDGCNFDIGYINDTVWYIGMKIIKDKCDFDIESIYLEGIASAIRIKDVGSGHADITSCYEDCGNAADPEYSIYVQGPRASNWMEYQIYTTDVNPMKSFEESLNINDYNTAWIEAFGNSPISYIRFGLSLPNSRNYFP